MLSKNDSLAIPTMLVLYLAHNGFTVTICLSSQEHFRLITTNAETLMTSPSYTDVCVSVLISTTGSPRYADTDI